MTKRIYIDRSRYEQYGRCPRSRWYAYSESGMGISSVRQPLPLAVGSSVHVGLAALLREMVGDDIPKLPDAWRRLEESAVRAALADFAQYARVLELPDAELAALTLAAKITTDDPAVAAGEWGKDVRTNEIDDYLYREQSALVEALVRAYSRRRLRPLLDQFEVLEVEREGEWELSPGNDELCTTCGHRHAPVYKNECTACGCMSPARLPSLWFMSRPDALLRERESNELYLLSYKTAASWDIRKARDAEHDMQGLSEGIEVERRLAALWGAMPARSEGDYEAFKKVKINGERLTEPMFNFLRSVDAPPRIHAVRYEYLLKGERWKDKELSARFNVEMRSQKSHLIRQYVATSTPQRGVAGYAIGDVCWSWDYVRDDGSAGSLAWQNWKSRGVFEAATGGAHIEGGVKAWIDTLDETAECMTTEDTTVGLEPRLLGYNSDAQAVGVTREHPLDAVFIPPITVYRNEDELRDLVDQLEAVERRIAEGVAAVEACGDDAGERRHALNVHFPQNRRACEYPTTCGYSKICYGGEDIRRDPLASGLYKIRTPNHIQELQDDTRSEKS